MLKNYVQQWEDEEKIINFKTVQSLTDYSADDWLELTGFYSRKSTGLLQRDDLKIDGRYPYFDIAVKNNRIMHLGLKINLKKKTIKYYEVHLLDQSGKNLGRAAHQIQISLALEMGFKEITLEARRSLSKDNFFNGYVTWAKFGYTMLEEDRKLFEDKYKGAKFGPKKREVKCLQTMIRYDSCFWKHNGRSWNGRFDLSEKSISNRIFEIYLKFPKRFSCPD